MQLAGFETISLHFTMETPIDGGKGAGEGERERESVGEVEGEEEMRGEILLQCIIS